MRIIKHVDEWGSTWWGGNNRFAISFKPSLVILFWKWQIEINIDIYFPKEKVYHTLHEVSPVVEALARTQFDDYVKRVRIFAHPRIANALRGLPDFDSVLNLAIQDLSP